MNFVSEILNLGLLLGTVGEKIEETKKPKHLNFLLAFKHSDSLEKIIGII